METHSVTIEGLQILIPDVYEDNRGYFLESYNKEKYTALHIPTFVQDNESHSAKSVLRGLHYQLSPHAQGKLVRVIEGEIFDVALDIRPGSPTFGEHVSVILSSANKKQFWIPPGFAHGFLVLSDTVILAYKCTEHYHKTSERSILWSDPELHINWPLSSDPIVSDKDSAGLLWSDTKKELCN